MSLRKKYVALGILHLECRFDLNGMDPNLLIDEAERTGGSKSKSSKSSIAAKSQLETSLQPSTPSKSPYCKSKKEAKLEEPESEEKMTRHSPPAITASYHIDTNQASVLFNPQRFLPAMMQIGNAQKGPSSHMPLLQTSASANHALYLQESLPGT